MKVFVLSHSGKPLMPTTPRRARIFLKTRRARVVTRERFTIQLCFETTTHTQPVTVGVDTGSQTVGIAANASSEVVFQAEMRLRTDVSLKLTRRRRYRRTRRSRKTRYRAARWANRRRSTGWLAPSLRARADATVKAMPFVARLLPIRQINVEIGSFDTQKMQNPEVSGVSYQQGHLQGYLLREYLLARWQRQCAYCHTSGVPLQVEHLVPTSRGGSERVAVRYGYETKYQRMQVLHLPKAHANDAVAIACAIGEVVKDVRSGKALAEVTPRKLVRLARCVHGWIITRFPLPHITGKEGGPSSPS
jgi:hypothetical protein